MEDQDQAESSVEERLEAAFAKQEGNPVEPEAEAEDPEGQPEAEAEEQAPEPEAGEEVEVDGEVFVVPKKLKEAVLRTKDYTQKTMALAEQRRELEAKAELVQVQEQFRAKHFDRLAEHRTLQAQLQQYEQLDWSGLAEQNPAEYLKLDRQFRTLSDRANRVDQEIRQLAHEEMQTVEQTRQKQLAAGLETLKKEFKDWGPEFVEGLRKTGENFGFTERELAAVTDPRQVRVLDAARRWLELQSSKPSVQKRVAEAKPMKVTGRAAQSTQSNAVLKDARDRVKKTGSPQAAEQYLERLFSSRKR